MKSYSLIRKSLVLAILAGANSARAGDTSPSPVIKTTLPTAPSKLSGKALDSASIQLAWTDNSTNEASFLLERKSTRGSDAYVQIATIAANAVTFTNKGLNAQWEYNYRLRSTNSAGSSAYSNIITVQVKAAPAPAPTAPAAPAKLSAISPDANSVQLTWADNSTNKDSFLLERQTRRGGDPFVQVAKIAANSLTFIDKGLNSNWEYNYRLRSTNAVGSSDYTAIVTVQVQAAPVSNPTNPETPIVCTITVQPYQDLQASLNAMHAGSTVCLSAGTFNIGTTVNMPSDVSLASREGAILNWTKGFATAYMINIPDGSSNVTLTGLVFNAGSLNVGSYKANNNITITNNTFRNISGDLYHGNGITSQSGMSNSLISGNKFNNINSGAGCMWLNSLNNVEISRNILDGCTSDGIHIFFYNTADHVRVNSNVLKHIVRHGIEIQNYGNLQNLEVAYNHLSDWVDGSSWHSHMALSIAVGGDMATNKWKPAVNTRIHHNVIIGNGNIPAHTGDVRWSAIEFYGLGTVENNYISNWAYAVIFGQNTTDNVTPGRWSFINNTLLAIANQSANNFGGGNEGYRGYNPSDTSGNIFYRNMGDVAEPKLP